MQRSESITELAKALSAFQGELTAAPRDSSNPFYHSRYADLATVWDAIRPGLNKNGLSVIQLPSIQGERVVIETIVLHASGEWYSSELCLTPMREKKDVGWVPSMDPQSVGSAITYGRRYSLCPSLGVVADDDDDAESAMGRGAEPSPTRMPQSIAMAPKGLCPVHHIPFVRHQGTGAKGPYDFWSCPQKTGAGYCQEKPQEKAAHTGAAAKTNLSEQSTGFATTSPPASPVVHATQNEAAAPTTIPGMVSYGDVMKWVRSHWPNRQASDVWLAVGVESVAQCTLTPPELAQQLFEKWGGTP